MFQKTVSGRFYPMSFRPRVFSASDRYDPGSFRSLVFSATNLLSYTLFRILFFSAASHFSPGLVPSLVNSTPYSSASGHFDPMSFRSRFVLGFLSFRPQSVSVSGSFDPVSFLSLVFWSSLVSASNLLGPLLFLPGIISAPGRLGSVVFYFCSGPFRS